MNLLLIILVVIAFIFLAPKIAATVKSSMAGAVSKSSVSIRNGEVDIDVSGKGACACANNICKGDCSDGSSTTSMVCACQNGECVGDCEDDMMLDPENFDPFEWVKQHS